MPWIGGEEPRGGASAQGWQSEAAKKRNWRAKEAEQHLAEAERGADGDKRPNPGGDERLEIATHDSGRCIEENSDAGQHQLHIEDEGTLCREEPGDLKSKR